LLGEKCQLTFKKKYFKIFDKKSTPPPPVFLVKKLACLKVAVPNGSSYNFFFWGGEGEFLLNILKYLTKNSLSNILKYLTKIPPPVFNFKELTCLKVAVPNGSSDNFFNVGWRGSWRLFLK